MIKIITELKEIEREEPVKILDLAEELHFNEDIVGAIYNGKIHDLNYQLKESGTLHLIHREDDVARQMLERSLSFLFISAIKQIYPNVEVKIDHSYASGLFCTVENKQINEDEVEMIRRKMQKMIDEKEPIIRKVVRKDEAVKHFEMLNMYDKADLLKIRDKKLSSIYTLGGIDDYFYGVMVINCSYIKRFNLRKIDGGVWLSDAEEFKPQPKLLKVCREYENWGKMIGVSTVSELNKRILESDRDEMILMSEAMIEKKLSELAKIIVESKPTKKIVLIAGPSSAGKTTFSKRLSIHLKILGIRPFVISLDDFYVDRIKTPLLPDGTYDYENVEAIDLKFFNETMNKLLNGESVLMPIYDFAEGVRKWEAKPRGLHENEILVVEGIHGLNPRCSELIADEYKFKVYINALTHLNYDNHNRIPTSDYRMIRRMVRDYQFRNRSARETINSWKNVRNGEDQYIYPYQEEADYIFNTSMPYEMTVLKKIALPLLEDIKIDEKEYLEANRLRHLLEYFVDGDISHVPNNSILAEFVGNSIFF